MGHYHKLYYIYFPFLQGVLKIFKWEKVKINNKSGQKLAGLLHTQGNSGPLVIFCHGFTGSKEGKGKALEMAEELSRSGWSTMLFDFAGNGESEGDFVNLTLTGQIADLAAVTNYCRQRGFYPLITLGRSLGGVTAICHAAGDSNIGGVCTWSTPANLYELLLPAAVEELPLDEDAVVALAGREGLIYVKRSFFTDILKYDICSLTKAVAPRPLLIIHGREDRLVPPAEAEKIYDCAGAPKELHWIDHGNHQFSGHYREAWAIVIKWLNSSFANNI